jgi:predicted nucleic acid-binding Zn ribbon protein
MKPSEMVAEWKEEHGLEAPPIGEPPMTVKVEDNVWALFTEDDEFVCITLFERRSR